MPAWSEIKEDGARLLRTDDDRFMRRLSSYSATCFRCGIHLPNGEMTGELFRCGNCRLLIQPAWSTITFISASAMLLREAVERALKLPAPVVGETRFVFDLDNPRPWPNATSDELIPNEFREPEPWTPSTP